jgi:hypothetical protein
VFALVYWKVFRNPFSKERIVVVPARRQFLQPDGVGTISIDFIGAHAHKHGLWRVPASSLEKIQCSAGIDIEIVEWSCGGQIVTRLGRRVDDEQRAQGFNQGLHTRLLADVQFVMVEIPVSGLEPELIPSRITAGSEELRPHVVIDAVNFPAFLCKIVDNFGADRSGGAGDKKPRSII